MEGVPTIVQMMSVAMHVPADKATRWRRTMPPALTSMNACLPHVASLVQISLEHSNVVAAKVTFLITMGCPVMVSVKLNSCKESKKSDLQLSSIFYLFFYYLIFLFFIDVNECLMGNGGCHHNCTNLDGTYQCFCREGFLLQNDSSTCTDVDECVDGERCEHTCENLPGTFNCHCASGYMLNTNDGRSCRGK